ncbi:dihydroxyacetone kinase subunit DhaK [Fundicoccus culcitae]|uniref:Dihydroxyacetone kinase subunit DhaK n=1 Tax=Fundicoccus culcitae TaxID=2969821 RepID=A0ABY5P3W0_9LACT|nr:dihydroxyacetone kinase subunit DhaK [Fundicoccus culcitae]UUX33431.1 dihydroxyacetone kinase subunit DhaK [Fundicoccus culcitae]
MNYFLKDMGDNQIVDQLIDGFVAAYSHRIIRIPGSRIIQKLKPDKDKVVIISGGGSGHEPAHIGYVGDNMLDVAVMGNIFEPPTAAEVFQAIQASYNGHGTLLIIKNFEKDVASFLEGERMAIETGYVVDHVIVNDDCSIESATFEKRKKGVAGTIFIHKILGTASAQGLSLSELVALGNQTIQATKTLGVAFSGTKPIGDKPSQYSLKPNEMYFGIGIHGEPGYRIEEMKSSERIALELTNKLITQYERAELKSVAIIVNGLGSATLLELSIFLNHVMQLLDIADIAVEFKLLGNFMTSYNTNGLSLTFLNLFDAKILDLLQEDTNAFAWKH